MNMLFDFAQPWYLALLVVVPAVVWLSVHSMGGLTPGRRWTAVALRVLVIVLIVLALADMQHVTVTDRLTVLFVLDRSQSLPPGAHQWQVEYVNEICGKMGPDDLAGVVIFGRDARIELPPLDAVEMTGIESVVDGEYTNLADAVHLALAVFPEDSTKRIVLVSDGNENVGSGMEAARAARDNGVPIDVVPVLYERDSEILVEKVVVPPMAQKGQRVNLKVVVRSQRAATGTLHLFQNEMHLRGVRLTRNRRGVDAQRVRLQPGLNVFTAGVRLAREDLYTFEAYFEPDEAAGDRLPGNNRASAFTQVGGAPRVLVLAPHTDQVRAFCHALEQADRVSDGGQRRPEHEMMRVVARGRGALPTSLNQLLGFDAVVLANLAREEFSDQQVRMLASYVEDLGGGLVMTGGPDSFGAGGWLGTDVEKVMPVEMEIKALKVRPRGALVMIMHASEMAEGNHWQKKVAKAAIDAVSRRDYVGLITWWRNVQWLFPLQPATNKAALKGQVERMTPGDMPNFDPGLTQAKQGLMSKKDAAMKHIIVISDGDPSAPSPGVVASLKRNRITVTTVLVAAHGNDPNCRAVMKNLAAATKGRFYEPRSPKALPKIYMKEARVVSRPLIYEHHTPFRARVHHAGSVLMTGLTADELPPLVGYVLTTPKERAEAPLVCPVPMKPHGPLLAHWHYGLGKAVAFTSDVTVRDGANRWAPAWMGWPKFGKFWAQIARWAMRSQERGQFAIDTRVGEGRAHIVIDARDKDREFLNALRVAGTIIGPDGTKTALRLQQTAPGRYEGSFPARRTGSHFVSIAYRGSGKTQGHLSTGVTVPYSSEFRQLRCNRALLEDLARETGGRVIEVADARRTNVFTHDQPKATGAEDMWHLLLFWGVVLFLFDVATRRIAPDWRRVRDAAVWVWAHVPGVHRVAHATESSAYLARLKSRKEAVDKTLPAGTETDHAAPAPGDRTFEPGAAPPPPAGPEAPPAGTPPGGTPGAPALKKDKPQKEESYMDRLRKAKEDVRRELDKKDPEES